jgi:hypothetical protein
MVLFMPSSNIRKLTLMLAILPVLYLSVFARGNVYASSDTTWSVAFRLNMSKAVSQHIFVPDSDYVYVIMDHGILPLKLVPGPGLTYTGTLFDQLDSGVIYNYHFRINDSISETVNRTLKPVPGIVSVSAWWNNEPLNITTFVVNMQYAVQYSIFNPVTDSVCLVGTMNNMLGSPKMQQIGTTFNYVYSDSLLNPGAVYQYKYRINLGDTASGQMELVNQPNRLIRIPDTLLTVSNDFNNFNPAKRLMTFQCDLGYYVKSHHFNVASDFLDVAGNFNGNGANDILFDTNHDTIYSLDMYLDTTWIHQGPLAFRFRINGDWNSAELQGKPDRNYTFHDTINQNPNLFSCYYNNLNPYISTSPWVYDVAIQGVLVYKKFLSGIYSYENVNGIPEGISTYRWLRSPNAQGTEATAIDSATRITYQVDTLDIGKWLVFEVTPKAAGGDSATGQPVRVVSSNSISAWDVGMFDYSALISRVYPNPAREQITVESAKEIDRVELINYLNQIVMIKDNIGLKSVTIPTGSLPGGLYLLKATTKSSESGIVRVIKL